VDCPKKHVWDIITDWNNASWVLGQPKTSHETNEKGEDIQVRTWANGLVNKVKTISKNETIFTHVVNVVDILPFPDVDYDSFFTTISLGDAPDLDPDTQTRIRYHTKATIIRGTYAQGRDTLKKDFYGPRILWYQKYFNCSHGIFVKRALKSVKDLHQAIRTSTSETTLKASLAPFFINSQGKSENLVTSAEGYLSTLNSLTAASQFKLALSTPIDIFVLPDYRVVSVEDIWSESLLDSQLITRIVIYQLNEFGQIVSARVYDQSLSHPENSNSYSTAIEHYFNIIKFRDIERVRALYAENAVLEDPTGYVPPRTFDSVYSNFYKLQKDFDYKRSPQRTYTLGNQVALVVDATFVLENDFTLKSHPIQIFTLNDKLEITHFEAFFQPKLVDFSKLDSHK